MIFNLVINDVERLFMGLFAICLSSAMKCVFKYFAHFKNQIVCFLITDFREFLNIV